MKTMKIIIQNEQITVIITAQIIFLTF